MNIELKCKSCAANILYVVAAYYFICGLSAILWPDSWFTLSGLGTPSAEGALCLAILGAQLLALGVGALLAARSKPINKGLVTLLIFSNIFDFLVTAYETALGKIATSSGLIFLGVSLMWCVLLGGLLKCSRE